VEERQAGRESHASVRAILRHQSANGALVASPDFPQYQFCWLRDGSFVAHALDRVGEREASARFHSWCRSAINGVTNLMGAAVQRREASKELEPATMPPARFSLAGSVVADDWPNFQIDGYGTWLWSLREHLGQPARPLPEEFVGVVAQTARYLSSFWDAPCFDVWEEAGTSIHTSTLGCVYAGLRAAAELLGDASYDDVAATVKCRVIDRARAAGYFEKSNDDPQVDASLLWIATPFRVVAPEDATFAETVRRIENELQLGVGLRRYGRDTYFGGGAWPVLTASLGRHYVATGEHESARRCLEWIERHFDDQGRLGEQFGGDRRDPEMYRKWVDRWGPPARDLLWSHAMYLLLRNDLAAATGEHGEAI
jgi:GH15 family glucan-1,4-alpha-glucosidase